MDDLVSQFVGITDSTAEKARQYLGVSDNNVEQAIALYFETGGQDLGGTTEPVTAPPTSKNHSTGGREIIDLDSDDDGDGDATPKRSAGAPAGQSMESDEEMARRLQEEMYGGGGGGAGRSMDAEGYRAPIARTRETLVGPDSYDLDDPEDMRAAMREQMYLRQQARMS